jgi:hypothetical protein
MWKRLLAQSTFSRACDEFALAKLAQRGQINHYDQYVCAQF